MIASCEAGAGDVEHEAERVSDLGTALRRRRDVERIRSRHAARAQRVGQLQVEDHDHRHGDHLGGAVDRRAQEITSGHVRDHGQRHRDDQQGAEIIARHDQRAQHPVEYGQGPHGAVRIGLRRDRDGARRPGRRAVAIRGPSGERSAAASRACSPSMPPASCCPEAWLRPRAWPNSARCWAAPSPRRGGRHPTAWWS